MDNLLIACADIGSVARDRFGWADSDGASGSLPSELAIKVAAALTLGRPVALGFECPMYVPLGTDERELTKARSGETAGGRSRPWSAGAGCGALATGLVQATWVLEQVARQLVTPAPSFLDWAEFNASRSGLYLWEAFVSGSAKGGSHVHDAALAVDAFRAALPSPRSHVRSPRVISLGGLALIRAGWSQDVELLARPVLVIKTVA